MQSASPLLFLNSVLADVCRAKKPALCFPTFISSNPVCLLLTTHLQGVLPQTIPLYSEALTCWCEICHGRHSVLCFLFFHTNVTIATWGRGLTSQIHNTLSRHSGKYPFHSLNLGEFLYLWISPCLSSSCPQTDKKWKSKTEFVMSEDLLAQAVGAHTISFWATFLGFQACRKALGLTWRKQVFSGSREGECCRLMAPKESFIPTRKWQTKLPSGVSALLEPSRLPGVWAKNDKDNV